MNPNGAKSEDKSSTSRIAPTRITSTLAVVGLSGPETVKGTTGVGKSALCNRLADFSCSRVINNDHWLYWGEAELDSNDYSGPTTYVRIVEQTVFLDDESFETLGNSCFKTEEYVKRALRTTIESSGKLMYICRDQLGQESDFISNILPNGKTSVDAFCVVFDVSRVDGRNLERQITLVSHLLIAAIKSAKKPVFLVATKCDAADTEVFKEFQKILQRKELKSIATQIQLEVSAKDNINIVDFLYLVAFTIDKTKNKPKILPYLEALSSRNKKISSIILGYQELLESLLPREEFTLKGGKITWPMLLADYGVSCHEAYCAYIAEFGPRAAKLVFEEHQRACREWWFEHELSFRLPSLRLVLRRMFDRSFLCQAKWEQLLEAIDSHPEFDTYFQPLGRSLDRLPNSCGSSLNASFSAGYDERLPEEVLTKLEAQYLFYELQRELIDEIALERQADKFRQLLIDKRALITLTPFCDVRVVVEEIAAFEKALPPDCAQRIYETFQEELKLEARRNFTELLLENLDLFVDLVVDWRQKYNQLPMLGLNEKENSLVHDLLYDDKRYRAMNALSEDRQNAIGQFASFVSLPLERHCPSGSLCADLTLSAAIENQIRDQNKFLSINMIIHGDEFLVEEFILSLKKLLSGEKLLNFNGCSIRINLVSHLASSKGTELLTSKVPTMVYLVDSNSKIDHLFKKTSPRAALAPIFVQVFEPSKFDLMPSVHQMGMKLAEEFHGIFLGSSAELSSSDETLFSTNNSTCISTPSAMMEELRSRFSFSTNNNNVSVHFRVEQLARLLRETCSAQMDTSLADLRVRISFACGDSFPVESILIPLLDQTIRSDSAARTFTLDAHLEERNIRVSAQICSYHNWLFAKWPLNTFQGHILVYSTTRRASWHHAKTAARLLVDAVGEGGEQERLTMGKSILLVAVNEPNAYFTNNGVNKLLNRGAELAKELGCEFATMSPTINHSAQVQMYLDFFERLYHNPLLPPADYYTLSNRKRIFSSALRDSYLSEQTLLNHSSYKTSTITGSANTLLSSENSGTSPLSSSVRDGVYQQNSHDDVELNKNELRGSRSSSVCSAACCALSSSIHGSASSALTAPPGERANVDYSRRGRATRILRQALVDPRNSSSRERRRRSSEAIIDRTSINKKVVGEFITRFNSKAENSNAARKSLIALPEVEKALKNGNKDSLTIINSHAEPKQVRNKSNSSKTQGTIDKVISSFIQLKSSGGNCNDDEVFYYASPSPASLISLTDRPDPENWRHIDDSDEKIIYSVPPQMDVLSPGSTSFSKNSVKSSTIPPKPPPKPKQLRQTFSSFPNNRTCQLANENIAEKVLTSTTKPILRQKSQKNRQKQIQSCRKAMIASVESPILANSSSSHSIVSPIVNLRSSRSMDSIVAPTLISIQSIDRRSTQLLEDDACSSTSSDGCSREPLPTLKSSLKNTSNGNAVPLTRSWTPRRKAPNSASNSFRQSKSPSIRPKRSVFFNNVAATTSVASTSNNGGFFSRRVASSWRRKKSAVASRKSSHQNSQQNLHSDKITIPESGECNIEGDSDFPTKKLESTTVGTFASWFPNRSSPKRQLRAKSEGVNLEKSEGASSTLAALCYANSNRLPLILTKCVEFIERNGGLETEGLYRVPGNQSQVVEIEKAFRKYGSERIKQLDCCLALASVHALATVLKKFLDTLTEPIVPPASHEPLLALLIDADYSAPDFLKRMSAACQRYIPELNRHVLAYLLAHLRRVAQNAKSNSMDVKNLSKVWGPTLFRPNFDSFETMAIKLAAYETAMYLILSNSDSLFLPN